MIKSQLCKVDSTFYFISLHHLDSAMQGDTVIIESIYTKPGSLNPHAKIVKILKRGKPTQLAFVNSLKPFEVILQNDLRFPLQFVSWPIPCELKVGQKIIVNLSIHHADFVCDASHLTSDEICTKVFGLENFPYKQTQFDLVQKPNYSFKDLRYLDTFTVDSDSSTDLDDALSLDETNKKIYVHIADLARYVPFASPLDKRLLERQTSFYLDDIVYHMSPEIIIKNYCSLLPNLERHAISFSFNYDPITLKIDYSTFFHERSLIKSSKRYSYDECNSSTEKRLEILKEIYLSNKFEKNCENSTDEVEKITKSDCKTLFLQSPSDWHFVIEFYMVIVNEYVDKFLTQTGIIHPRRYHPPPVNMETFLEAKNTILPSNFPPELKLLLIIINLQLSIYSVDEGGHFGLNKKYYTHVTSPIRRYIDLVNQRLLMGDVKMTKKQVELVCEISNQQQTKRRAVDDLRQSLKEIQLRKVGDVIGGIVTNLRRDGSVSVYLLDQTKIVQAECSNINIKRFDFVSVRVTDIFHKISYEIK